jgi:cytoskeleton-associated protein 5
MLAKFESTPYKADKKLSEDLYQLVPSVVPLLTDKNSDIRATADKVLVYMCCYVGLAKIKEGTKNFKPAQMLQVNPILEAVGIRATAVKKGQSMDGVEVKSGGGGDDEDGDVEDSKSSTKKVPSKRPATASAAGSKVKSTAKNATGAAPKTSATAKTKAGGKGAAAAAGATAAPGDYKTCDAKEKNKRLAVDAKRLKGGYRELSGEDLDELKESMRSYIGEGVFNLLWDEKDFKNQAAGIDRMATAVTSTHTDQIVSFVDLVFKYLAMRLSDANTSLLLSAMKLTSQLMTTLASRAYPLTDAEASSILPTLVEKVIGHNTKKFARDTRDIVIVMEGMYAPAKIVPFLLEGLKSKNKRVQTECGDEIGALIGRHGVVLPTKALPELAKVVSVGADAERKAALFAISEYYRIIGAGVWESLPKKGKDKLPDKTIHMIEERLKRTKVDGGTVANGGTPGGAAVNAPAAAATMSSSGADDDDDDT